MSLIARASGSSLLFACAVSASLFFDGAHSIYLAATQVLLITWLLVIAWCNYSRWVLRLTPLTAAVMLYWLWLGLTLFWTPTPLLSTVTFWWLGSLPLTFFAYTITENKDYFWHYASIFVLAIGISLALTAEGQFFILHKEPASVFVNINSHAAFLNLVAIPLSAYVLTSVKRGTTKASAVLSVALFVLFLSIALVKGRGATLTLFSATVLLLFLDRRDITLRGGLLVVGLLVAAFVIADISWAGAVIDRLGTLENPTSAGASRFIIWKGAWRLFLDAPWWGSGLGTFAYIWPPYRNPLDTSGGYYVHNDYLQLAIEAGIPGVLLLAALILVSLWLFVTLRRCEVDPNRRIHQSGLFLGLAATAAHSFVDFNLYVIPILLVSGVMLARLNSSNALGQSAHFHPVRWVGVGSYRLAVVFTACIPVAYFISLAISDHKYQVGLQEAATGNLQEAYLDLSQAIHLSPYSANVAMSLADLNRQALAVLPSSQVKDKAALLRESEHWLSESERLNPYQPRVYWVRGLLYAQNPTHFGRESLERAEESYRRALQLDPRFLPARVACSQLLLRLERKSEARDLLEQGAKYWYFPSSEMLPFYLDLRKLRMDAGDQAGAVEIESAVRGILQSSMK